MRTDSRGRAALNNTHGGPQTADNRKETEMRELNQAELDEVGGGLTPEEIAEINRRAGEGVGLPGAPFDPTHPWTDWSN